MADHPYLPQSERLYFLQPQSAVQMQMLWKVMNDVSKGLIDVNTAVNQINALPTMPTATTKGDIIVWDGIAWVIFPAGTDGDAIIADSLTTTGLRYTTIAATPGGANTQVQFNNAGAFGADASFTTTTVKVTITKDRTGVLGALHITRGDAAQQYIVLEEDAVNPDFVYLTFKSSGGNAIAMGMEANAGAPVRYIFTNPAAAILAWIDVTTGDLGVSNLSGVGSRMVTASAAGVLATAAIPVGLTDGDKGDVTVSASGATWTIDNTVVTFAKMQDIATDRILGRDTAGSGSIEELTLDPSLGISGGALSVKKINLPPVSASQWNPIDGTTVMFNNSGILAQNAAANLRNIYPPAGTLMGVHLDMLSTSTTGSNENISIYVRLNDTTDYLIATVGNTALVRIFENLAMNGGTGITFNGTTDFYCYKVVCPTWATNPAASGFQGYVNFYTT